MVYGCDPAWWRYRHGLPNYRGLRVSWSGARLDFPDIKTVDIVRLPSGQYSDDMHFDRQGVIGGGGNSGFQALNLAVQLGARRILLIGFDMNEDVTRHWYGRNTWAGANNPDQANFRRWLAAFRAAAPVLRKRGVEVINCNLRSGLKAFPRIALDDALA